MPKRKRIITILLILILMKNVKTTTKKTAPKATEAQLLEKFKVEELEKRYEMGWFAGASVIQDANGNVYGGGKAGYTF